jgi:plastocyanin
MPRQFPRLVALVVIFLGAAGCMQQSIDEPTTLSPAKKLSPAKNTSTASGAEKPVNPSASTPGTLEGSVRYVADPKRRWRLGRYYIRDAKQGHLAEVVVALRGVTLKKAPKKAASATVTIDQKDDLFTPETVVLRAGDRVKFTNSDAKLHNVKSDHSLHSFSFNLLKGKEAVQAFERAVNIREPVQLGCAYHSSMRAWIYVFDHPFFQLTGEDGRFRLADVPPGDYRLEVVHPAGGLRWTQPVTIEPGKSVQVDIRLSADDRVK